MKNSKILLCMTAVVCLAFQACAQSDPLGESASGSPMGSGGDYLSPNMGQESSRTNPDEGLSGMVQWLDQPVPKDVTKRTTTATSTTPSPDAAKSTATTTRLAPGPDDEKSTMTSTKPATEPTSTTKSTTSKTPGFEATSAISGILAVTFATLRRRRLRALLFINIQNVL